jgi:hypothetical protein
MAIRLRSDSSETMLSKDIDLTDFTRINSDISELLTIEDSSSINLFSFGNNSKYE